MLIHKYLWKWHKPVGDAQAYRVRLDRWYLFGFLLVYSHMTSRDPDPVQ